MSDASNGAAPEGAVPQIAFVAQFVRDLSFENQGAGQNLQGATPKLQVGIDVKAQPVGQDLYEAALRVMVDAKAGDAQVYVVELVYCGVFSIKGLPSGDMQPFLLIEVPRLLFPFARRIVADVTRDGGYQPLMLEPIDFAALYRQQLERQRQSGNQTGTA